MIERVRHFGIYFCQKNMIDDGYYVKNPDNGNLIWKKYVEPTTLEKLKYKLKYGYSMKTGTISTHFYFFNKNENGKVRIGSLTCDAITLVKKYKDFIYTSTAFNYSVVNDAIIINDEICFTELKISEDGNTIFSKFVEKNPLKYFNTDIHLYLDFHYL